MSSEEDWAYLSGPREPYSRLSIQESGSTTVDLCGSDHTISPSRYFYRLCEEEKSHTHACTNENPENPVYHSRTLGSSLCRPFEPSLLRFWSLGREHEGRVVISSFSTKSFTEKKVRLPRQKAIALIPGQNQAEVHSCGVAVARTCTDSATIAMIRPEELDSQTDAGDAASPAHNTCPSLMRASALLGT